MQKNFKDLTEREILALAISLEEEDIRSYSDLAEAMVKTVDNDAAGGQLFNISMTDPVDYGDVAAILQATRGMRPVEIKSSFYSNTLSNAKARAALDWRPQYDLKALIEAAFTYQRAVDDPRRIWYAG